MGAIARDELFRASALTVDNRFYSPDDTLAWMWVFGGPVILAWPLTITIADGVDPKRALDTSIRRA